MTETDTIKLVDQMAARPEAIWAHVRLLTVDGRAQLGRIIHQVSAGLDADDAQRHGPGCTAVDPWIYRLRKAA